MEIKFLQTKQQKFKSQIVQAASTLIYRRLVIRKPKDCFLPVEKLMEWQELLVGPTALCKSAAAGKQNIIPP